jgi:hypothetical protein
MELLVLLVAVKDGKTMGTGVLAVVHCAHLSDRVETTIW